jgi:hypothetical protein
MIEVWGEGATQPASANRVQTARMVSFSPHHAWSTSTPGPSPRSGTAR